MGTTLKSLADGVDVIFTGLNFEDAASNVAEYYDLPLATLHYFPLRPNGQLLSFLLKQTERPVLLGTWAAAKWAISFYQGRGFGLVPKEDKDRLLEKYWSVPAPQARASVVLADGRWFESQGSELP